MLSFLSTSLNPHNIIIHNPNASILIPIFFNQSKFSFLYSPGEWLAFLMRWRTILRGKPSAVAVYGEKREKLGEENNKSWKLQWENSWAEPLKRLSILIERLPAWSWPCVWSARYYFRGLLMDNTYAAIPMKGLKKCPCLNKTGAKSGSVTKCVLI